MPDFTDSFSDTYSQVRKAFPVICILTIAVVCAIAGAIAYLVW